jgi:hypothetical protein
MTGTGVTLRGVVIADSPGGGPIAHTRFYIEPVVGNDRHRGAPSSPTARE